METVVTEIRDQIATLRKQREEIEVVLVKNRENVILWLESTSRSCQREVYQIKDNGDIADGEIHIPWNLLQEAIAQLREAQELMRRNSDDIADSEHDLADAEF